MRRWEKFLTLYKAQELLCDLGFSKVSEVEVEPYEAFWRRADGAEARVLKWGYEFFVLIEENS